MLGQTAARLTPMRNLHSLPNLPNPRQFTPIMTFLADNNTRQHRYSPKMYSSLQVWLQSCLPTIK